MRKPKQKAAEPKQKPSRGPRRSNFERALKAAEKMLEKCLDDHKQAHATMARVNTEIPRLQSTIQVLRSQLGMDPIQPAKVFLEPQYPRVVYMNTADPMPYDLTGMGSTAVPGPVETIMTEDDTLPDPEGTEVL